MISISNARATENLIVTKQFSVPPLSLTYDDVGSILSKTQSFILKANNGVSIPYTQESTSIAFTSGEDTVSLSGWKPVAEVRGLPKVTRSLRVSYQFREAPISKLEITLADGYREVVIAGTDDAQVQAISSFLRESLSKHEATFGGPNSRILGAVVLVFFTIFFLAVTNANPNKPRLAPAALGLILFISIFVVPWINYFPGVAIYAGSANFFDRYANPIGVITGLATILGFAYHFLRNVVIVNEKNNVSKKASKK